MPDVPTPPMMPLPVVENAFTRGAGHGGGVIVRVEVGEREVRVVVRNGGAFQGRRPGGQGIGLVERRASLAGGRFDVRGDGHATEAGLVRPRQGGTVRVLIADDEELARRRLSRLCGALPDVEIAGEARDGAEVLAGLAAGDVDVVLLDISMPGLTGVEAMQLWPADGPAIVFTTAHAEHALAAFDGGAVDYLLKPVEPARLARALARVASRGARASAVLAVETRGGVVLLHPEEIVAIVVDGASTVVHATQGRYFTDRPLAELEARLVGRLERVHRAALLNLDHVTRFEAVDSGGYLAWTDAGVTVSVSRQAARGLRRRWGIGPGG